ncbi:MBL fold metallo-hydrolase [Candidatus Babeliales bacterium]|nr:MBL fold metallo-hydrolase [Candidatus Babeliales bacterium]
MKITFLGTKGHIKTKSRLHKRHTSTLISHEKKRVMIDCGQDWIKKVWKIKPNAIIITHTHPDHAFGLKNGSPCDVYATKDSWKDLKNFPIKKNFKHIMPIRKAKSIEGITFEAFKVAHSITCPAVGYRITIKKTSIFYVPDLVAIRQQKAALKNIKLYIGDGATITGGHLVRKKGDKLFGHTSVKTQLGWCQKEKVLKMIVTHCGSEIVKNDGRIIRAKIKALGKERNVEVDVAKDGMEIIFR